MDEKTTYQDRAHPLTVKESAEIFISTLHAIISEESPFSNAPFIKKFKSRFSANNSQFRYFTTKDGLSSYITVQNGTAEPNLDLNLNAAFESKHLKRRIAIRLGAEPTDEQLAKFAFAHELAHLIQALFDSESAEFGANRDIQVAQEYFASIIGDDIDRSSDGAFLDANNYSDEEYVQYVNSDAEANADFIALWIMGIKNPDFKVAPQNEGYGVRDWKRWADTHRIKLTDLFAQNL